MRILLFGGTGFLGRHLVQAALEHRHTVTLFNRGLTHPELFPHVEQLHSDRKSDLQMLQGRTWDAVIDSNGQIPHQVRESASVLAESTQHYTFISSTSVYADYTVAPIDERSPVSKLEDPTSEDKTPETYGARKALCEHYAEQALPNRVLVIRPGLIVGPDDPTDRFTYWPHRIAHGGEVLAPGDPEQPVQFIDVRDLAAWSIAMVETRQVGVYNAKGPDSPLTMRQFLECCHPRDAQRDALLSELALGLPLTNCHLAVLEPSESRCKQTDKKDEMACSDHQLPRACLLSSRCATRGKRGKLFGKVHTRPLPSLSHRHSSLLKHLSVGSQLNQIPIK